MRNRFDQFGKQMVRTGLEGRGSVETDAEVPADTRHIDLWFVPDRARAQSEDHLGLLGRITVGPSTLEFFHNTPGGDELTGCVLKHGNFRHYLSLRNSPPPLPVQWVISSGRPEGGISGLRFESMTSWPRGMYDGPPLLWTRLVVVNELPVTRDTLLLRLLGADAVLAQAIAELRSLPEDAPERMLAGPILVRLKLSVPTDPAEQTPDDQEFLMQTEDIGEAWRRKAVQEGIDIGREQGERLVLLRQLRQRFGDQVDSSVEQHVAAAPAEQLERWAVRVLSAATLAELLAD